MLTLVLIAMIAVKLYITSPWFWGVFVLNCLVKILMLILDLFNETKNIDISFTESDKE